MIAIKGMEMLPRSCMNCDMFQMVEGDYGKCRCYLTQTYVNYSDEYLKKRADDCPLVEIEERKVGKWILSRPGIYTCSICGLDVPAGEVNHQGYVYCPKCSNRLERC